METLTAFNPIEDIKDIAKEESKEIQIKEVVKDLPIKEVVRELPVKDFAKEKFEQLKEISVRQLAKDKYVQYKESTIQNYNTAKDFIKANPVLGIATLVAIGFASIPLVFVLSTLVVTSSILFSVSFVILSVLTFISALFLFIPLISTGVLIFIYYTIYVLATATYKKSVVELKNKGNSSSYKIVINCFTKSLNEYIFTITSLFKNVLNFIKFRVSLLTNKVDLSKIKNMRNVIGKRASKTENKDSEKNKVKNEEKPKKKSIEEKKEE